MKTLLLSALLSASALHAAYETTGTRQVERFKPVRTEFNALPTLHTFSPADRALAAKAWETICAWQADGKADSRKLHMVYVTLRDRPALPDHKARFDRILKNIQTFYANQMAANGYPPLTFALDLDANGKVVVHDVLLDGNLADYTPRDASADPAFELAKAALSKQGVDLARDYVLIVCQIPDGLGPYCGTGTSNDGRCWICDLAHLDPLNLGSKAPGDYRFKTLGPDNTVYIGGTAHELGHCFSLPHTMTPPGRGDGESIMGAGNYHYGSETRGEKGAYLIESDALRLASIPLFTGKEKKIENPAAATFTALSAEPVNDGLRITGRVSGNPPVYGIVAYFDPAGGNDYDASSTIALPEADGTFTITVTRPGYTGIFDLRLVLLQADGTCATHAFTLNKTAAGIDPSSIQETLLFADVQRAWKAGKREEGLAALAKISAPPRRLAIWKNAFTPPWRGTAGIDPATAPQSQKKLSLEDAKASAVKSGWGNAHRNTLDPLTGAMHPFPLIPGHDVANFLYTHTPGAFTFNLGGQWKTVKGLLAVPAQADYPSIFTVLGDGKELLKTPPLKTGTSQPFTLDVTGISTLEIRSAVPQGERNSNAFALLADAVLLR